MATDVSTRQVDNASLPEQDEENSWALFALAWRRKWILLFLMAIGLGLGYLFYLQQTPIYQSVAQLLIVRERAKLPIEGIEISSSYDTTHETLIRSPLVLKGAISRLDIASLPSLKHLTAPLPNVADPKEKQSLEEQRKLRIAGELMRNLAVEVGGGMTGDILVMSYRSVSPEDCPKVLHAVFEAYQEFLGGTYKKESAEATRLIEDARRQLGDEIDRAKEEYQVFRREAKLLFSGESAENLHEKRLQRVEDERARLVLENSKLRPRIDAIEKALQAGGSREALNLMVGKLRFGEDDGVAGPDSTLEVRIFPLLLEEQMLLERYGPDHPKVRAVQARIRLTREHLLGTAGADQPVDFLEVYLESLREQILVNDEQIASLDKLFAQEERAAKLLADTQIKDETLRSEIERKVELYDVVLARLQEINLAKDTRGTKVDLIYPPLSAYQVEPNLTTIMIAAGLLGTLAGLGLAFLVDASDRRFRSPDEIRTDLGIPVVGHIPVLPGVTPGKNGTDETPAGSLSPALRTHFHPRGRIAEAYRAVRTALYFSTRGSGHQVIQVTSPSPGDGKSTLSGNLALSIANSGKRALLIDADFRRPRIHRLFGLDNSLGISSVIEGKAEIPDAVQQTQIENLSIMSCGPRPENPSELLSSRRFAELLDLLREQYDLVIVDTPPVLAVTDPLNVVTRVDGVLLVLRLTKSARSAGRRALDSLDGMGAKVLGIVINGVGGQAGYGSYGYSYGYGRYGYGNKGGYGGYRYGYGSNYGYQYEYGNGYGDDNTYYEDDDDEVCAGPAKRQGATAWSASGE